MITVCAHGFVGEKPELQRVSSKSHKVEFDVVSQRSVRNRESQQWEKVWERATFVAWDEEAEKIASTLDKGNTVTCTGLQETSSWLDSATGKKQYRTKYKLTAWSKEYQARSESGGRGEPGNSRAQGQQRHSTDDGDGPHFRDEAPRQREPQQTRSAAPQPAYADRDTGQQIDM